MKNTLNLLLSSAVIALAFSAPQTVYGSEQFSTFEEQKRPSAIQLQKVTDDHLEAVLGTGNNVLLKISMSLEPLKGQLDKEQLAVPARLFLTDFTSLPLSHPAVDLKVNVDCEPLTPTYTLPVKPQSFESYAHFTEWLSQAYFTNRINITYDFHIDPRIAAPSLMSHLFPYSLAPGGYHISGTHVIHNAKITPDNCVTKITYISKRGDANATTTTMAGILYLYNKSYSIDDYQQTFLHPKIDEILFKRVETKTLSSHKWLTQTETITNVTYAEFPTDQLQNWPNAPSETYSLLRRHLEDIGKNDHIACWDGTRGEKVDLADGRVFSVVYDAISKLKEGSQFLDSIVKDHAGKLYTIRYKMTTINALTDDLLNEIFLNMDGKSLHSITQVSKRFNSVSSKSLHNIRENIGLSKTIQHVKDLQNYNLTYGMFLKVLEAMKSYYMTEEMEKLRATRLIFHNKGDVVKGCVNMMAMIEDVFTTMRFTSGVTGPYDGKTYDDITKTLTWQNVEYGIHQTEARVRDTWTNTPIASIIQQIKEILKKKMEIYEKLQGTPHPRRDEVNKL